MKKEIEDISKAMIILPSLMRYFQGSFKPELDMTIKKSEIKAVSEIHRHPNLPMKHYADAANMEFGSFTYLANKLEKKGLIERTHSSSDKRITALNLTDNGADIANNLREKFDVHIQEQICTLSTEDVVKLSTAIGYLEDILDKLESDK